MSSSDTKTLTFSMLVEKHGETYVGHCLETGIVAAALDESDVIAKMSKMLERQIKFALENGRLGAIYHAAPADIWNKFLALEEKTVIAQSQKRIRTAESNPGLMIAETAYAPACC